MKNWVGNFFDSAQYFSFWAKIISAKSFWSLTFDTESFIISKLFSWSDACGNRADTSYLQSSICVRVKLWYFYAQLTAGKSFGMCFSSRASVRFLMLMRHVVCVPTIFSVITSTSGMRRGLKKYTEANLVNHYGGLQGF